MHTPVRSLWHPFRPGEASSLWHIWNRRTSSLSVRFAVWLRCILQYRRRNRGQFPLYVWQYFQRLFWWRWRRRFFPTFSPYTWQPPPGWTYVLLSVHKLYLSHINTHADITDIILEAYGHHKHKLLYLHAYTLHTYRSIIIDEQTTLWTCQVNVFICLTITLHEQPHLPPKISLDVMQSHPLFQDAFQPIPGLISCAGATGRWRLLSYAQNVVRWLHLSIRSVEAPQKYHLFVQLSSVQQSFIRRS